LTDSLSPDETLKKDRGADGNTAKGSRDEEISPEETHLMLQKEADAVCVDIRPDWEARMGRIEGARLIPVGVLDKELGDLGVSKDRFVILYCSSGARSLAAARKLSENGYRNAHSVEGGFIAWMNAGYPVVKESPFTVEQLNRYSRQILLEEIGEEGQLRLLEAKILVVGAGGLGSPAGLYLASCGVGTLGIADFDTVDLSNLNRQIFHGTGDVGTLKTDSARRAIERLNPDVKVITYTERVTPQNLPGILEGYDMILDAADNVETKFLLNDAAYFAGKPYIYGGAVQLEGQMSVFHPAGGGPCLRCLFPVPPPQNLVPT
jgi:adenylyltransferase/sulfurtransferase